MQINNVNSANTNNSIRDKVSFSSTINLVDTRKFFKETQKIQGRVNFVGDSWVPAEITRGKQVITQGVKSCTAGGIIVEALDKVREVIMFHLNPDMTSCKDFAKIKKIITDKIGDSKPVQAFMVGSKDNSGFLKYSGEYFDDLWKNVISTFNVPTSFLKGMPMGGSEVDLYCDVANDTWLVSCSARDKFSPFDNARKDFLGFKDVKISDLDKLVMD